MVVILTVLGARLRIKEVVASDEFENLDNRISLIARVDGSESSYHASHTPDIGAGTPLCSKNDLW